MALLTATNPAITGTVTAAATVSASDTISQASMSSKGCTLLIINGGGSSDTVGISDQGTTQAGHQLAANATSKAVANGTAQIFHIKPEQVNQATGLVTITHTFTTSVTYYLWSVPV